MNDINFHYTWFDVFMMLLTMVLFLLSNISEVAGIAFVLVLSFLSSFVLNCEEIMN